MGETRKTWRLSYAAGRRAADRLAEGPALTRFAKRLIRDQSGATAVEYAVLIVFLGAGIVAALGAFQTSLFGVINDAAQSLVEAIS